MLDEFLNAVRKRRTCYALGRAPSLTEEGLLHTVKSAVKHCPSANNSQSQRVVMLFSAEHDAFWELTRSALAAVVPPERFGRTSDKIDGFKAAFATILFFEDMDTVGALETKYPKYAHNFRDWSSQASGMLQYIVWTALAQAGIGASLQHYAELVETETKRRWNIPDAWKLISQMPVGNILEPPGPKDFKPLADRILCFPGRPVTEDPTL